MHLKFGLNAVLPENPAAAWGARLIISQDGWVDFLGDRSDCQGDALEREKLLAHLNHKFPMDKLKGEIAKLLKSGVMSTRVNQMHDLYEDGVVKVMANTNASYEYCYVSAWLV